MSIWGVGYPLGIATGLSIGLVYASKLKPWSELSSKKRKIRIGFIVIIAVLLVTVISIMLVT